MRTVRYHAEARDEFLHEVEYRPAKHCGEVMVVRRSVAESSDGADELWMGNLSL